MRWNTHEPDHRHPHHVEICEARRGSAGPRWLIAGGWNGTNELATSELYSPVWSVRGFYEPVDMRSAGHPITVNRVKSGATVPFKFEVFAGATELTSVAVVASIVGTNVTCTPGAEQDVERIPLTMHGSSRLRYDRGDGHFIFKWQTPSHSTGKCYRIDMTTQDGSSLSAFFKLK